MAGFRTTTTQAVNSNTPVRYRYYSYGGANYRRGVRVAGGPLVTDRTLTATGWSGAEDTDWENLETST